MTPQDGASAWLGLSLQDWTNIATIFGAIGTFITAIAALLVSVAALRTQREALPVSAKFTLSGVIKVDNDGVRWVHATMQNTGVRAYVHDVYPLEWKPNVPLDMEVPNVPRVSMPESMPESLRSLSKRRQRRWVGVFKPSYVRSQACTTFLIWYPPGFEAVQICAAMGIKRRDQMRFVYSEWLALPQEDDRRADPLVTDLYFGGIA